MDPLELASQCGDALFVVDAAGKIVLWNPAAEQLLGRPAPSVLHRDCNAVLGGLDPFGNRFCGQNCVVKRMSRRHEPVHGFRLEVPRPSGEVLQVHVSVLTFQGDRTGEFYLLHVLHPVDETPGPPEDVLRRLDALTPREREVLDLLAGGAGTAEIADVLFISAATVRNHVQNLLRKLDVHSKLEAVCLALRGRTP